MRAIAGALVLCLGAACATPVAPVEKPPAPPPPAPPPAALTVDALLEWLPVDTETLVACRVPFQVEAPVDEDEEEEESDEAVTVTVTVEEIVQSLLLGSVGTIRKGKLYKRIANRTAALAIQGSRKFRRPTGLGQFRYEGCDILVFEGDATLDAAMKYAEDAAEESYLDQDTRVLVFREKLEADLWTFLLARPRPNVLLCATDRNYLGEVLVRFGKPAKTRAFPKELPEWKLLESTPKVWALRHYIRGDEDAHSESFQDDSTATGMVFFPSTESRSARVRFLSRSKHSFDKVKGLFDSSNEGLKSKVNHENGVIEVDADCGNVRSVSYFFFVLLACLGHGIFL